MLQARMARLSCAGRVGPGDGQTELRWTGSSGPGGWPGWAALDGVVWARGMARLSCAGRGRLGPGEAGDSQQVDLHCQTLPLTGTCQCQLRIGAGQT